MGFSLLSKPIDSAELYKHSFNACGITMLKCRFMIALENKMIDCVTLRVASDGN